MKITWLTTVALTAALIPSPVRAADTPIVIEVAIYKLQDKAIRDLKLSDLANGEGQSRALDPAARTKLSEALNTHGEVVIASAPKFVVQNHQAAVYQVGQQYPVTKAVTTTINAGVTNVIEYHDIGTSCKITPVYLADQKAIHLQCEYKETMPRPTLATNSITTLIQPVHDGAPHGEPVPVTQSQQLTVLDTIALQSGFTVPDEHSVLVSVGKPLKREIKIRHKLPILGDCDLFGDLFTWDETTEDQEHTIMLLTAKMEPAMILPGNRSPSVAPIKPVAAVAPVAVAGTRNAVVLKVLLEQYEVACKIGDAAKAGTIAAYCLEMDPTCFANR